jgi:hypothetical protein
MLLRVTCAACGRVFLVDGQYAGRKGRCPVPECRRAYIVPAANPADINRPVKKSATLPPAPPPPLPASRPSKKSRPPRTHRALWILPGLALSIAVVWCLTQFGAAPQANPALPGSSSAVAAQSARQPSAFETQAAPFLRKYCFECHSGDQPEGMISLAKFTTEKSLLKNRKTWERALDMLTEGVMPPADAAQPTADEKAAAVAYFDRLLFYVDCSQALDPGRVTIRRLNRAEYNNTLRDLVGVDFRPADDFPSDDVGYGFDNIGDVLSLPPLLMEKYLDAADAVVQRAMVIVDPQHPPVTEYDGKRLQLSGSADANGEAVTMASSGHVTARHEFPLTGEYKLRITAWQDRAGDEPAKMEVRLDGKVLQTVRVEARRSKPESYEVTFTAPAGTHAVDAAFINDFYNEKQKQDRNLHVAQVEVVGPTFVDANDLPAFQRQLIAQRPSAEKTVDAAVRDNLRPFVRRAFRRPVREDELTKYVGLANDTLSQGESFDTAMQQAVTAVLVAPEFLFRLETDRKPDDAQDQHPLNDHELATRLSYFLWSSLPDDELFAAADRGDLHADAVLTAQVLRMLKDSKSQALIDNFAEQWLQLRVLNEITPDPERFPNFTPELRADMQEETKRLFAHLVREDRDLRDLLDAPYTFVNERLAQHYGFSDVKGPEFRQVSLAGTSRSGLLTHGSVLTMTSNPNRTSPVKRGKWIMEVILDTPPPPPPPNVPELEATNVAEGATLREQLSVHRANPSCASCHRTMDELGFGLENFDAIGRWRDKDGDRPLDVAGELPDGRKFRGPQELAQILDQRSDDFGRALSEKLLTYALGRGLEYYDRCATQKIQAKLKTSEFRFSALATEIALSEPFRLRRGEEPATE